MSYRDFEMSDLKPTFKTIAKERLDEIHELTAKLDAAEARISNLEQQLSETLEELAIVTRQRDDNETLGLAMAEQIRLKLGEGTLGEILNAQTAESQPENDETPEERRFNDEADRAYDELKDGFEL